jgi:hypothetical protein
VTVVLLISCTPKSLAGTWEPAAGTVSHMWPLPVCAVGTFIVGVQVVYTRWSVFDVPATITFCFLHCHILV